MESVHYRLLLSQIEECKQIIQTSEETLEKLPAVDSLINASFYRVSAEYYKAIKGYPQYYHNALLFLSSISLDDLSIQEKQQRAFDLCMSALLGEGLYNFGELVLHINIVDASHLERFGKHPLCLVTTTSIVLQHW